MVSQPASYRSLTFTRHWKWVPGLNETLGEPWRRYIVFQSGNSLAAGWITLTQFYFSRRKSGRSVFADGSIETPCTPPALGHQGHLSRARVQWKSPPAKGQKETVTISSQVKAAHLGQVHALCTKGKVTSPMTLCLWMELGTLINSFIHLKKGLHFVFPWDLSSFPFAEVITFVFVLKGNMGLRSTRYENY